MENFLIKFILFLTFFVTGCYKDGFEEPSIYVCTVIDTNEVDCVHVYDQNNVKKLSIVDVIGYQCVSPNAYATLDTHHEILHKELNRKKK